MATAAYRDLWRATRIAFHGDAHILTAARSQIRESFLSSAPLEPAASVKAIEHAREVAKFLRENVVQGKRVDGEADTFQLRIHEHTERGDNESIKTAGKGTTGGGCGCK
jgi:complex III assembly factor LYRM7